LSLSDSAAKDEGEAVAVQQAPISAVLDDVQARAPPASEAAEGHALVLSTDDSAAASSDAADPLSTDAVTPVLEQAIDLWLTSGLVDDDPSLLAGLNVLIADLPDNQLGFTDGTTITLDATAAGHGWFVDPTPQDNTEYGPDLRAAAGADNPAFERVDLLTVLLHEVGHVLGFEHDSGSAVMAPELATGQRVLLDSGSSAVVTVEPVDGALTMSPAGTLTAQAGDTGSITFRIFDDNHN